MHLEDQAIVGERLDVAPYRFQGHAQPLGQAGDGDGALLTQEPQDFAMPFGMDHRGVRDF